MSTAAPQAARPGTTTVRRVAERPRVVLHTIDTTGPGGAETVYVDLVARLDPARFTSVTTSPVPHAGITRPGVSERGWLHDALRRHGHQPLALTTRSTIDWRYVARLVRLVRQHRAEVIHAHLLTSSVYAGIAGRLCGVPVIATFHGESDAQRGDPRRAAKLRAVGLGASRVVFVSEYLRRSLLADAPIPASKTTVIYNGIDVGAFAPGLDRAARAELGVPDDAFLVGAVGNVRTAKAYEVLLRAIAQLAARAPHVHAAIVGDLEDAETARLLALRAELGLEHRVRFLGFRSDVPRLLRAFDAYALTSSSEGFSIALVQAMAAGRPVVATRSGGPVEILDHGRTGVLVGCNAPAEVAAALQGFIDAPEAAAALGQAARTAAAERFSVDATVRTYESLYESLAPRRRWEASA